MRNLLDCLMTNRLIPNNKKMELCKIPTTLLRASKNFPGCAPNWPSCWAADFITSLTELRVEKSPLHGGMDWIKVVP